MKLFSTTFRPNHWTILLFTIPTMLILSSFINNEEDKGLPIGAKMPLPTEQMENTDGSFLSLNDLKQENGLIVVFSCNTCPFVVGNEDFAGWEKDYNSLYDLAAENKIGLVLINSNAAKREGDDSLEKMIEHATDNGYKMPYLVDENSKLADAFEAKTTPHVFLFNKGNKLVYKGSIDNSWDSKRDKLVHYLKNAIHELSKEKDITIPSSSPRGCSIKRVKPNK